MIVARTPIDNQAEAPQLEEAVVNLLRTASQVEDGLLACLRAHDIHPAHYNVLRILRTAGRAGLGRNEIRDRLFRKHPDVTRLLDRMATAGLVVRLRDNHDRRCTPTRLTAKGRRLVDALDAPINELYRQMVGPLAPKDLVKLNACLSQIVRNSGNTPSGCHIR